MKKKTSSYTIRMDKQSEEVKKAFKKLEEEIEAKLRCPRKSCRGKVAVGIREVKLWHKLPYKYDFTCLYCGQQFTEVTLKRKSESYE